VLHDLDERGLVRCATGGRNGRKGLSHGGTVNAKVSADEGALVDAHCAIAEHLPV
jgi:hypothetical protein